MDGRRLLGVERILSAGAHIEFLDPPRRFSSLGEELSTPSGAATDRSLLHDHQERVGGLHEGMVSNSAVLHGFHKILLHVPRCNLAYG